MRLSDNNPVLNWVNFFNDRLMKLSYKLSHLILCCTLIALSSLLTACEKPAADIVQAAKEPQQSEHSVPDLGQICQNLKKEMMAIDAQRTTLAIEQVNQDIRLCLPLMKPAEQKELMQLSKQMYQQFLQLDRTSEQQHAFQTYALDQSAYPTIQQSHFEQLNIRDQYLLRHKGQAYIELIDQGDNKVTYRRNPQYLAKVFAPYLDQPEQKFIENLAQQNAQPLFKNQKLNLDPEEIAKRAIFWQEYTRNYPESPYIGDAHFLENAYTSLLFLGPENSPISLNFENANEVDSANWMVIERLADSDDGALSTKAQKFEQFINMSTEQRRQKIQLSVKEQTKLENHPQLLALSQLNQFLNLKPIDFKNLKKDCFSDAICSAI